MVSKKRNDTNDLFINPFLAPGAVNTATKDPLVHCSSKLMLALFLFHSYPKYYQKYFSLAYTPTAYSLFPLPKHSFVQKLALKNIKKKS